MLLTRSFGSFRNFRRFASLLLFIGCVSYYFPNIRHQYHRSVDAVSALFIASEERNSTELKPAVLDPLNNHQHSLPPVSTPTAPAASPSSSPVKPTNDGDVILYPPELATSPSDVLLIMKTGASTVWRRIPMHLTTLLSNGRAPNSVIYSDLAEQIANDMVTIDVLANVTGILYKYDMAAYNTYFEQQSPNHKNTYREQAHLPGDEPQVTLVDNSPGWFLDKYKFLPMLTHAQRNWPGLKWYIYIEDDTFIFWDNILQWLATLSPDEPSYYGSCAGEGNATFAQGGSGIVFSRSLMSSLYGGDIIPDLETYGNYTARTCCGDIILGKILRDYGIAVNKGVSGGWSFKGDPPWKTYFEEWMWCHPVFSFHHVHQKDLVQLAQLERSHEERPFTTFPLFRDIFINLISPYLVTPQLTGWDNFAKRYILTNNSATDELPFLESTDSDNAAFAEAFNSPAACRTACIALVSCRSWRHDRATASCGLDTAVILGREVDPQASWAVPTEVISGWLLERITETLLAETCREVKVPRKGDEISSAGLAGQR